MIEEKAGEIWERRFAKVSPTTDTFLVACIVGGQPGAGKSSAEETILARLGHNAAFISMDEYRKTHPLFGQICEEQGENFAKYTHGYVRQIADRLFEKAIKHRLNIAYESTLRSVDRVSGLIHKLQNNKYGCSILVVSCSAIDSYIGTKKRTIDAIAAGEQPRGVATEDHDAIVKILVENVQKLCDNFKDILISIQTREAIELWNNQDEKYKDINPSQVLQDELKYSEYLDYKRTLKSGKGKAE
ncbi:hypothetical protein FACS189487_10370 [Campylobacterota bacterium]|nr:hypothetical protein FACS189487_10370 [Campylobacterota bacterium]